jgi:hypothetical protein
MNPTTDRRNLYAGSALGRFMNEGRTFEPGTSYFGGRMYTLPRDFYVVTRRIEQPPSALRRVLGRLPDVVGQTRIDEPFTAVRSELVPSWRAVASLSRRTRVHIELTAWSKSVAELRVHPMFDRVPAWGRRRQNRYFELAHRGADDMAAALESAVRELENTTIVSQPEFADTIEAAVWHWLRSPGTN